MLHIWTTRAGGFAEIPRASFFKDLVGFMTRVRRSAGFEGENAVALNRELMGATNPKEAAAGTIRADFAQTIDTVAAAWFDSPTSAAREVAYFFEPK